jgi:hypothetical protein
MHMAAWMMQPCQLLDQWCSCTQADLVAVIQLLLQHPACPLVLLPWLDADCCCCCCCCCSWWPCVVPFVVPRHIRGAPSNSIYNFDTWGQQLVDFTEQVITAPAYISSNSVGGEQMTVWQCH